MPRAFFATLLATFAEAFPHTSVWLVDQSTLLIGSREPHLPDPARVAARLATLAPGVRRSLHTAGIAGVDDLLAAWVGVDVLAEFGEAERLCDDRPVLERIGYWSGERRLGFYPHSEKLAATAVDDFMALLVV